MKQEKRIENEVSISLKVECEFNSLYKLAYFLVDLNSICSLAHKINSQSKEKAAQTKKYRGMTYRNLNKDNLKLIKLREFRKGCFFTSLVTSLISTAIVGAFVNYYNRKNKKREKKRKIDMTINGGIIINNGTIINDGKIINMINRHIRDNEYSGYDDELSLRRYIERMAQEMVYEKLLKESGILYDEEGKKQLFRLFRKLERLLDDEDENEDEEE